jgi:hypothetical protein
MRPSSRAFAAPAPADVAEGRVATDGRRRRNIAAAGLLIVGGLVQCGGFAVTLHIDESYGHIWLPFALWAPPVACITSLILGDRRQLWVKLNYLFLGFWVLLGALGVLFFELIGGPG